MSEDRLQKVLAAAGVASRRKAEQLIVEGQVSVNGKTVTELGTKVDPHRDTIRVDGKKLRRPGSLRPLYLLLHKPREVISTTADDRGFYEFAAVDPGTVTVSASAWPLGVM